MTLAVEGQRQFDAYAFSARVKARAAELGFDLAGIAPAEESKHRAYLRRWLDDGQAGTMAYLAARFEERTDPRIYMPGARSVVCVAMNYHQKLDAPAGNEARQAEAPHTAAGGEAPDDSAPARALGRVARYALGEDYHEVLKARLYALADWMRAEAKALGMEATTRAAVDTAPLMEKELAARAGVGWLGKNNCIIHPRAGSWLLLGEVVTTLPLPADEPGIDRCGTCTRCIEACPTQAITAPYQLDARRCISYLTIEHRSGIDPALRPLMGEWLFGCDICQEVCPWNTKAPLGGHAEFAPRFAGGALDAREVMGWTDEARQAALRRSAMKRVKLPVLQRNAAIVVENAEAARARA